MVSPEVFVNTLREKNIGFFAGVPDSLLKNVCAYITDNIPEENNIITANEGAAVGVACGHYLTTGEVPVVYMQNSGIGNAVNPLLSLADEKVYSIPLLLLIGWRGEPGVHDEPQHVKQGEVTLNLLESMGIPYIILPDEDSEAANEVKKIADACMAASKPHAIVVRKGTFGKYELKNKVSASSFPLSREEAMKVVVDRLPQNAVVVSTTGKLSRELFEYRESKGESHKRDFLTVGSMGHSSSIALGIALADKKRPVYCFDGDGAFIMHLGALSNIGKLAPGNYTHILFNNGAHESVGAQPTLGFFIDAEKIARGCGYKHTCTCESREDIVEALSEAAAVDGPSLIQINVGINSRENLGRPTTTPQENKKAFMKFLG